LVVCKIAVLLNRMERDVILAWHDYSRDDLYHYGGAALVVPEEQAIVRCLTEIPLDKRCLFSEEQIAFIADWMRKAISRRYGSAQYVTAAERAVYEKTSLFAETLVTTQDDDQ
jgi:hypothetical protein